jgi:hypothetical protein
LAPPALPLTAVDEGDCLLARRRPRPARAPAADGNRETVQTAIWRPAEQSVLLSTRPAACSSPCSCGWPTRGVRAADKSYLKDRRVLPSMWSVSSSLGESLLSSSQHGRQPKSSESRSHATHPPPRVGRTPSAHPSMARAILLATLAVSNAYAYRRLFDVYDSTPHTFELWYDTYAAPMVRFARAPNPPTQSSHRRSLALLFCASAACLHQRRHTGQARSLVTRTSSR